MGFQWRLLFCLWCGNLRFLSSVNSARVVQLYGSYWKSRPFVDFIFLFSVPLVPALSLFSFSSACFQLNCLSFSVFLRWKLGWSIAVVSLFLSYACRCDWLPLFPCFQFPWFLLALFLFFRSLSCPQLRCLPFCALGSQRRSLSDARFGSPRRSLSDAWFGSMRFFPPVAATACRRFR